MKIQKSTPHTNGSRHKIKIMKNLLSKKNTLVKNLTKGISFKSGRNSSGTITVRHQGGRIKNLFRLINFKDSNYVAVVVAVLYDPLRSAFISFNFDLKKNCFFQTLSTNSVLVGSLLSCDSSSGELYLGSRTTLENIPTGSIFNSLSLGGKTLFSRSAGTFCQLLQKTKNISKVRLPSGKIISLNSKSSFGTLGVISNTLHSRICIGKAGVNRLKGKRPSVRGIAMNPVDHPHGGRTNGGMPSVTPWGIPTKGKPTVKKKITSHV